MPEHNSLVDLRLAEPGTLFSGRKDLHCHISPSPLPSPHFSEAALPYNFLQHDGSCYSPLHKQRQTCRTYSKTDVMQFSGTSTLELWWEKWGRTYQIQNQTWTSQIWGPAEFCLWLGKGGHMRDLLHLASAGGCNSSGGAGTGRCPRSATGIKRRPVLLWLLPTPQDPSYQMRLATSHAQEHL